MPFNVGDCASLKTSLGFRFSVDITGVIEDPETGKVTYRCVRNGIDDDEESTPPWNSVNPIFDPSDLKATHIMPEISWHGVALRHRVPREGDDEKRAFWISQIQKHAAAIADKWQKYAHIKEGVSVSWKKYGYDHVMIDGKCVSTQVVRNEYEGIVSLIWHDFECFIKCNDGETRQTHISNLTVR